MSRMRWDKAKKPLETNALTDEKERYGRDAAARWLAQNDVRKPEKKKKKTRRQLHQKDRKPRTANVPRPSTVIYTDGACIPNPGNGGWAFVVYENGKEVYSEYGGEKSSTNNIMEMTGVKMAIKWAIGQGVQAVIISDSQYVVKGCNAWRFSWKGKGWRRNEAGRMVPVKNADLWKELDELLETASVTMEWCKGHVGIVGNERADELSNVGRLEVMETVHSMAAIERQLSYSV